MFQEMLQGGSGGGSTNLDTSQKVDVKGTQFTFTNAKKGKGALIVGGIGSTYNEKGVTIASATNSELTNLGYYNNVTAGKILSLGVYSVDVKDMSCTFTLVQIGADWAVLVQ